MVKWYYFALVFIASIIGAFGAVYLKLGANEFNGSLIRINIKKIFVGVSLYGLASLIALIVLKNENVSVIYPLSAMSYIWVAILSRKYFKENINIYQWLGILFILFGVIFLVQ